MYNALLKSQMGEIETYGGSNIEFFIFIFKAVKLAKQTNQSRKQRTVIMNTNDEEIESDWTEPTQADICKSPNLEI